MAPLTLSILEIIVLMLGAIVLGFTIHFFIFSRKNFGNTPMETIKVNKSLEEWKLKYFNDTEIRDKELSILKKQLADTEENLNIYTIEAEEMRKENKKLLFEIETLKKLPPQANTASIMAAGKPDYIDQLKQAQTSLMEHNEKIKQLLGQIDIVKEAEEKQQEILKNNEQLSGQIDDLKFQLTQKEKEVNSIKQKEHLTKEMTSMLDSTYNEFHVLQDKIHKLEGQVNASKRINLEYEDLKEGHQKMIRDFEEQKLKYNVAVTVNQQMQSELQETEDKLREANFQRQQLQKRVSYLEELNNDMQAMADTNKKLENQIKRIGELESLLNMKSEEKSDDLHRQIKT
jgi:chromosome segregation ATPase